MFTAQQIHQEYCKSSDILQAEIQSYVGGEISGDWDELNEEQKEAFETMAFRLNVIAAIENSLEGQENGY